MKKIIITGGNGDIAKAIAKEIQKNFNNIKIFLPTKDELDVVNINCVQKYFADNKFDILINNAGMICVENIKENNINKQKDVIDTNILGVFFCTNAILQNNPNAKIINIGSSAGTKIHSGWSSYCASKAAVIMATKCWAEEGVDTICISPGRTLTKMRKFLYPNEDPSTLMKPKDFAKIIIKALNNDFQKGINLDVNTNNIKELLNE